MRYDSHKHRRRSIRLPTWDYGETGVYYVTICTADRECVFDNPDLRAMVEDAWLDMIGRGESAGEFVMMPNHVHGIIWMTGGERP